jgi:hypothetical protein
VRRRGWLSRLLRWLTRGGGALSCGGSAPLQNGFLARNHRAGHKDWSDLRHYTEQKKLIYEVGKV